MIFPPSSHGLRLVRASLGWQPGQAKFEAVSVGRHTRVFKVSHPGSDPVALKEYAPDFRTTQTLEREFNGLRLFERFEIRLAPLALEWDTERGVATYRWEEGSPLSPTDHGEEVFEGFADLLVQCARIPVGEFPHWSSKAVSSAASLEERLRARLARLPADRPDLQAWVSSQAEPELEIRLGEARTRLGEAWAWDREIPPQLRILAPVHLGFDSVLETPSRHLVFVNLTGFGQDDPAAILARILSRPGDSSSPDQKAYLLRRVLENPALDPQFLRRFEAWLPLVALDQILDHLDAFLPLERPIRDFAGLPARPKEEVLATSLEHAINALHALKVAPPLA